MSRLPLSPMAWKQNRQAPASRPWQPKRYPATQPARPQIPQNVPGNAPGQMNVQTSIQPQGVFPAQYTHETANLAHAQGMPALSDLMTAWNRPGVSMGSGAIQAGMQGQLAQQMAQGIGAAGTIPQQHQFANLANLLSGQMARDQEALGWAGQGARNAVTQQQFDIGRQATLFDFLRQVSPWWM